MRESVVESYLVEGVTKRKGLCYKFLPATRGVPDRIVIHPNVGVVFVELKAPGEKPRKQQIIRHKEIREAGGRVLVLDTPEAVYDFLKELE